MSSRNLKCQTHRSPAINICLAGDCESRMVCQICYQTHTGNHLANFVPVEKFLDETIKQEIIERVRESEELLLNDRQEIEKVFVLMEEIARKEISRTKAKLLSKLNNENETNYPTLQQVNTLFKAMATGKTTNEEINFLANLINKCQSNIQPPKLEINADFLNNHAEELKSKIQESESAFSFSKNSTINFEKLTKVLQIRAPGKNLVSSPFDLKANMLAVGCSDTGLVDVYLLENGTPLIGRLKNNGSKVLALKILPESQHILVAGVSLINIFKFSSTQPYTFVLEKVYTGHSQDKFIFSMELLDEHSLVISGGNDRKLRVWNIHTLVDSQILDISSEIGVIKKFEGNYAFVGTKDGNLFCFKCSGNGKLFFLFSQKCHDNWLCSIDFNLQERLILTGSNDSKIRVWNLEIDNSKIHFSKEILTNGGFVRNALFLNNPHNIFYVNWTQKASFYSLLSDSEIRSIAAENKESIFTSAMFSLEKKFLLLGNSEGFLNIYSW